MKGYVLAILGLFLLTLGCVNTPPSDGTVHLHADFAMFINGQKFNFTQEKYMTDENHILSNIVHFHDMDGDIIHVHAPGVTLGMFFKSLGMKLETVSNGSGPQHIVFTDDQNHVYDYTRFGCYEVQPGQSICADPGPDAQSWHLYVNGESIPEDVPIEDYVMKDLDQILLTNIAFNQDVQSQLDAVTDNACIQSDKCPEKGHPSPEASCAGAGECGVGTIPTS